MKFLLAISFCLLSLLNNAEAQDFKMIQINFDNTQQTAVTGHYSIQADWVEGAFRKKMSDAKLGTGEKSKDGFRVYKGITIPEISETQMDMYMKVEADNETGLSILTLLFSKGYNNYLKPSIDSEELKQGIHYLESFVKDATRFQLNAEINQQNELITTLQKERKKLKSEESDLRHSKEKMESKIANCTIESGALQAEMENQQKLLDMTRAKTASLDQVNALKKEVSKQESNFKKSRKKFERKVDDCAALKTRISKMESDIEENQNQQGGKENQINTETKKLKELQEQLVYLQ